MENNKYKTKEEWKELINKISPQDFQDLCFDIIKNNGFKNVKPLGKGGDGGRDIEADFTYKIANKEEITLKCWFQCKRQSEGVNFKQFSTEVQKAQDQNVGRFFIISNADTTSGTKTDIENWNKKNKCQISDWTGTLFLDLLFELPSICKAYFPDENVPPVVDAKEPKKAIELSSNVGKRFGIEIEFKIEKQINLNNPTEVAEIIKDALLKTDNIDLNIKSLIYNKISMFFFAIGRADDALMFLNKSLDITPKNVNALLNKGYILEKINENDESNKCYDELLKIEPKNIFALNNKGFNLRKKGLYDEALAAIDGALDINPNFILAINNKVNILKGLRKIKEALAFLDEKKSCFEKSIDLMTLKVDLCIEILDLKEAFKINKDILAKNPDNIISINNEGVIFEKNSRFQKREKYLPLALECFENVIKNNKNFALGWSNKFAVLLNSAKLKEAEELIDVAYTAFPKNHYILNKKGVLLLNKGNPKEALKYFEMALKLFYQEEYSVNKAKAHIHLGQWIQAKESAEKVLKYNNENSDAWELKGMALRKLHQTTLASICFKNAEKFKEKPISLLED